MSFTYNFNIIAPINIHKMDKKLTLSLNEIVIENAKNYAKTNNISISKLVETYLKSITAKQENNIEITPLVQSISGVITLPNDFDVKEEYTDFLMKKYK